MTRSVKVGDKVRVVNAWHSGGQYKNGDVLTVEQTLGNSIITKEASRLLLSSEYELYEPIKVGDTVTLIDKPWETDVWKGMDRWFNHGIMRTKNSSWTVININKGHYGGKYIDCDDSPNESPWKIPLELLRKVDDGINAEWIATGVVDDGVIKGTVEPKKGDPATSFKPGKKYVYSKELNKRGNEPSTVSFLWHDMCDGKEVDVTSEFRGSIGSFVIIPQWCYEIPTLHRHTPEQIADAQRIIGEIVAGFKFCQYFYIRNESDRELTIRYTSEIADGMHTITAHCSPHDEYNRTIGLLVALCKATGRKLPDWV